MTKLSESVEWEYPQKEFIKLTNYYDFHPRLDVSATKKNSKCKTYINKKLNALTECWYKKNWTNPPSDKYKEFCKKACDEFLDFGNQTMMIIPSGSICTRYSEKYILPYAEFYPIVDKIEFYHFGKIIDRSRNNYFVVIWRN